MKTADKLAAAAKLQAMSEQEKKLMGAVASAGE